MMDVAVGRDHRMSERSRAVAIAVVGYAVAVRVNQVIDAIRYSDLVHIDGVIDSRALVGFI